MNYRSYKQYDVDKFVNTEFHKDYGNGIFLTDSQVKTLNKYHIDYLNCVNVGDLIFHIEHLLNEVGSLNDLDLLSSEISEFNYYNRINK